MSFLKVVSKALAKVAVDEMNMTPEQRKKRKAQKEADKLGEALGVELIHVDTYTQKEFDALTNEDKAQVIRLLRNESERLIARLNVYVENYISCRIGLAEMAEAVESLERTLYEHIYIHTDTRGVLSNEELDRIYREYEASFLEVKRQCHLI